MTIIPNSLTTGWGGGGFNQAIWKAGVDKRGYWPRLFAVCISSRYAALQLWPLGTGRAWGACQPDSKKDKEAWRARREMVTKT
jgi:hypothetical protein